MNAERQAVAPRDWPKLLTTRLAEALSPRRNATDFPTKIIPAQSTQQRHANTSCLILPVSAQTQLSESEKEKDTSFFSETISRGTNETKRTAQLHEASFLLAARGAKHQVFLSLIAFVDLLSRSTLFKITHAHLCVAAKCNEWHSPTSFCLSPNSAGTTRTQCFTSYPKTEGCQHGQPPGASGAGSGRPSYSSPNSRRAFATFVCCCDLCRVLGMADIRFLGRFR